MLCPQITTVSDVDRQRYWQLNLITSASAVKRSSFGHLRDILGDCHYSAKTVHRGFISLLFSRRLRLFYTGVLMFVALLLCCREIICLTFVEYPKRQNSTGLKKYPNVSHHCLWTDCSVVNDYKTTADIQYIYLL